MTFGHAGPKQPPAEAVFCGCCREHAEFTLELITDDVYDWLSTCCGARPVPVDIEPRDDL